MKHQKYAVLHVKVIYLFYSDMQISTKKNCLLITVESHVYQKDLFDLFPRLLRIF
jgi:hypothetical protein